MTAIDTSKSAPPAAAAGASGPVPGAAATDSAAGTEDRFLKLLVAQMRNQDPLNPLDNAQVTSQLAQINTVRGIEQLNASVSKMAAASGTVSPVSALGLLGRQVLVPADSVDWPGPGSTAAGSDSAVPASSPLRLGYQLPAAARAVRVELIDAAGRVVFTHEAADAQAGVGMFPWNGAATGGGNVPAGTYRLRASALGYDGVALAVEALAPARVTAVSQAGDGARVELGGRAAQPASAVRAVL
ncbi:MAG: Basal-body rod modification protein FlgD [Pseudorhodoplanes sp.]|nr:Basal-body rod modification protein FlgD [Pseudorhodoplanes sp.]